MHELKGADLAVTFKRVTQLLNLLIYYHPIRDLKSSQQSGYANHWNISRIHRFCVFPSSRIVCEIFIPSSLGWESPLWQITETTFTHNRIGENFHVRAVHLGIVNVFFIHQLMNKLVVLKNNINIYIKTTAEQCNIHTYKHTYIHTYIHTHTHTYIHTHTNKDLLIPGCW